LTPSQFNNCNEQQAPSSAATKPDVVLSDQAGAVPDLASLALGQVLEVRLAYFIQWSWTITGSEKVLAPAAPINWFEPDPPACVWQFFAQMPGTVSLAYSGRPVCPPGSLCPYFVVQHDFEVTVKR
jgi:hypothetical protein